MLMSTEKIGSGIVGLMGRVEEAIRTLTQGSYRHKVLAAVEQSLYDGSGYSLCDAASDRHVPPRKRSSGDAQYGEHFLNRMLQEGG